MNAHLATQSPCVLAVRAAMLSLAFGAGAQAAEPVDPAIADLVQRTGWVEVGLGAISNGNYKANEFSGLQRKGGYFVGNLDLRGGGEYGSDDATRWRLKASDLGTNERSVQGEYGVQGRYRLTFGYDELQRNRSDSYQTPLLGAGSNVLTLPGSWIVPIVPRLSGTAANARGLSPQVSSANGLVNGVSTAPTAAQLATSAALQAADLPAFHNVDLSTQRNRYDLGLLVRLDSSWDFTASYRHEHKEGLKPMGTVTRATGGDIATIIPDLIDQTTEQFNAGVQYRGQNLVVQAGYYGSVFKNNVPSMTWSNWALPGNAQTMSSAPGNQFHQLNLTANYAFTHTTRLVANLSYARTTQNDAFLTATYTPLVPVSSLNGLVVTRGANLKLTSRPWSGMNLSAGYKLDDRDNRTSVNTYGFYDAGEAKSGTSVFSAYFPGLGANANLNANRPYSRRLNQANLDADLRLSAQHSVKAGFEGQVIDRYCSGSWISCADASKTRENSLRLEWRAALAESLNTRLGVVHASRTVNYNEDAWLAIVPAAALSPTGAPGGATAYGTMLALGLTGYGPILGLNPLPKAGSAAAFFFANNNALSNALYGNQNRISELPGMRRFNMADRQRDKLRLSADWQAAESLSVQFGYEFNDDHYSHSVYGLQRARNQALNLDASYAFSDEASVSLFASHEQQRNLSAGNSYTANSTATNVGGFTAISGGCYATIALRNASNKVDACLNWQADMQDRVDTFGAAYTRKGMLGGKLEISSSLAASRARSTNDPSGGNYVNNPLAVAGAPAGTTAAYFVAASSLPVVVTRTLDLSLAGRYALSKVSSVRVGYRYQHMTSSDWAYDGLQYGGLAGVLPTNELAPNYTVHTVNVAYTHSFR